MAWTSGNPVSIGDPTKKSHFDNVFDNGQFERNTSTGAILATLLASFGAGITITAGNFGIGGTPSHSFHNQEGESLFGDVWPTTALGASGSRVAMLSPTEDGFLIVGNNQSGTGINRGGQLWLGARGTTATPNLAYVKIIGARESATSGNRTTYLSILTSNSGGAFTEALHIDSAQKLSSGAETSPDVDSGGLCLNHGANDGNILTFKSSDVAHSFTTIAEADTYAEFKKSADTPGGLNINSYSSSAIAGTLSLNGYIGSTTPSAIGVSIEGWKLSGTTGTRMTGSTEKVCVIAGTGQWTWYGDGGAVSSNSPTGGNKGNGTLNAKAVYDDNVLLTGYVIEQAAKGSIDLDFWNKRSAGTHERAKAFDVSRLDIDKFGSFWKENLYLPSMFNDREMNHNDLSAGQIINGLWETVEVQAAHIDNLNTRLKKLEKHILNQ